MTQLTMREWNALTFIQAYLAAHSAPPSLREIMRGCDISSTCVVRNVLRNLAEAGVIELCGPKYSPRAYRVLGGVVGVAP